MPAFEDRPSQQITGMESPTVPHCELNSAQPCVSWPASICKEHLRAANTGPSSISQLSRTERVLRDLHWGRQVPDADLLQHREDTRFLMEVAHDRWLISGDPKDLAEARQWMHRRDEAITRLSPEWKAAREARIQESIGAGYFIEAGERDRAQLAGNE